MFILQIGVSQPYSRVWEGLQNSTAWKKQQIGCKLPATITTEEHTTEENGAMLARKTMPKMPSYVLKNGNGNVVRLLWGLVIQQNIHVLHNSVCINWVYSWYEPTCKILRIGQNWEYINSLWKKGWFNYWHFRTFCSLLGFVCPKDLLPGNLTATSVRPETSSASLYQAWLGLSSHSSTWQ